MKNKLTDLNDHLFAQIERMSEESLSGEKLREEIDRSKAIATLANSVIENGKLVLEAMEVRRVGPSSGKQEGGFPLLG